MSYKSVMEMASNQSLIARIAACAAANGLGENHIQWAQQNIWKIAASVGWSDAWDYAEATKTVNVNPDTGLRNDVITDAMIDQVVAPLVSSP